MDYKDYSTAEAINEALAHLSKSASQSSSTKSVAVDGNSSFKNITKVFFTFLSILTLVIAGAGNTLIKFVDNKFTYTSALSTNNSDIKNLSEQAGDENILLVGTDSRYGRDETAGAGDTTEIEGVRSDTIILLHLPADASRAVAISFPRDLQVDRPDCTKWDPETNTADPNEIVPAENAVKLNSTYSLGGPSCLTRVIQNVIGLKVTRFAAIDFVGFKKMINLVGGVEVCTTKPLIDDELGIVLYKRGYQKLYGGRALNYVRARHIEGETTSDYARIKRQQVFLTSLLKSLFSSGILKNGKKLNELVNAFTDNSLVDGIDVNTLLGLVNDFQHLDLGRTSFITIPTETIETPEYSTNTVEVKEKKGSKTKTAQKEIQELTGYNYKEIPLTNEISKISNALINGTPLPNEKPLPDDKSASTPKNSPKTELSGKTVEPNTISVKVTNGTGETGLATNTSQALEKYGIKIPILETLDHQEKNIIIQYPSNLQAQALTLAAMFPGALVQEDNSLEGELNLILGLAYEKSIDPPLPANTNYTAKFAPTNRNPASTDTAETSTNSEITATVSNATSSICI